MEPEVLVSDEDEFAGDEMPELDSRWTPDPPEGES